MSANDRPVVTRQGFEDSNTAQSGGLKLITGVGPQHTPATRLWFGKASNPPFRSLPHHHGEAETGAYLLSGRARIYFGKDYRDYVEMSEGDFMFVPPFLPHLEANMSTTEELWWLACRTPENIVINLPDVEDSCSRAIGGRSAIIRAVTPLSETPARFRQNSCGACSNIQWPAAGDHRGLCAGNMRRQRAQHRGQRCPWCRRRR